MGRVLRAGLPAQALAARRDRDKAIACAIGVRGRRAMVHCGMRAAICTRCGGWPESC